MSSFSALGGTVLVGSRKLENGQAAAKSIGEIAHTIQLDVTDQNSIAAAAQRVRKEFGRLDVLANNAGIVGEFPPDASSTWAVHPAHSP